MNRHLKRHMRRVLVLGTATVFLLLGLAGLVLPILQGWFFLALSAILYSMYSPALRGWLDKHTVRYPKIHAWVGKAESWVVRIFGAPEN
jgi:uncharacterized membrane protein YbaN (DUF454 family)